MAVGLNNQFLQITTHFLKTAKGIKDLGMKLPSGILKIVEYKTGGITEGQKAFLRVLNKSKDGMSAYDIISGVMHLINHQHKTPRHKFVDVLNLINPAKDVMNYAIAEGLVAIRNPGKALLAAEDKKGLQGKYVAVTTPQYFISAETKENVELVGHIALLAASLSRIYDAGREIHERIKKDSTWTATFKRIGDNDLIVSKALAGTKDVFYVLLSGVGITSIVNKKAKIEPIVFTALSLTGTAFAIMSHYSLEYNKAAVEAAKKTK